MFDDTIAALATPPGEAGIAVIRLSGNDSLRIAKELFVTKNKSKLKDIKDRHFYYGYIVDKELEIVDEVLMVWMKSPRTYTREDIVEIHCHGGMIPIRKILELTLKRGARQAEPGEFTKRAFLNGRIDLAQAEGIMDLISAKTEEGAKASINQLEGGLSARIKTIRDELLNLLAHIEVTIDYPEEDIEDVLIEQILDKLNVARNECLHLLSTAHHGKLIREGIKTVIIGKPNVGKSSLLNALLKEQRAIVTDIPGTTRDIIEESINIRGILVRIIDTAGIRETIDIVEKIGVERSKEIMKDADLVLLIFDASEPLSQEDKEILKWLNDRRTLILLNKIDRPAITSSDDIKALFKEVNIIETSMVEGIGIEKVEDYIYNLVYSGEVTANSTVMITNNRHKEALIKAEGFLNEALAAIDSLIPLDIVTIDIRNAWQALGEITGESLTENLIDKIFMEFCLGK